MNHLENSSQSKEDFILNVLSLVPHETFSPVQIQKLFFLLEKRLRLSFFNFKPYHYGPYDKGLTDTLTLLCINEKVQIKNIDGITNYQIKNNYASGQSGFFNPDEQHFIKEMVSFIKRLSFKELCMSIYNEFPDMAVNSIFFGK